MKLKKTKKVIINLGKQFLLNFILLQEKLRKWIRTFLFINCDLYLTYFEINTL